MSLCAVGSLEVDTVGSLARKEELAIVPDIQGFHYMFSDPSNHKRYRNYSDCFSGEDEDEEQLNLQDCISFSAPTIKKHCSSSYTIICSPDTFQPTRIEKPETFIFGTSAADSEYLACGIKSSPQSSASSLPPSTFSFESSTACEQSLRPEAFNPVDLLPDMQHPAEVLTHQQASTHSSDSYKLVIKEQPEEVYIQLCWKDNYKLLLLYFVILLQYYRARYDSEGVRAPLKGLVENYPAVQVCIIIKAMFV